MDINRIGEIISEFWKERKGEVCAIIASVFAFGAGFNLGKAYEYANQIIPVCEYVCPLGGEPVIKQISTAIKPNENVSEEVVASKKGTKYHYLYCPGAKTINESNLIHFKDFREAENAGYSLAKNCTKK